MLATKRRFEPSVIQRLLDEPYRFQFFQAVRMLEQWLKRNGVSHDQAVGDYLRFRNTVSLNFPPSEIEALSAEPAEVLDTVQALLESLQNNELKHINITPSFMGFLGGNGTLPSHYTERIAAHLLDEKDDSPKAFLDTFSNRSVALFFEAWRKYRLEFKYEIEGKDHFLPLLLSLAGLGHPSLQERLNENEQGVLDESVGFYAAALQSRPPSAGYIQRILAEYFAVPVVIKQFIGCWYTVPHEQQTMLGGSNAILGSAAMVGARVWQRDLRLRITIGPLDKKDFNAFLPGGKAAVALEKMLTMFTSLCLEYEIQLVLRAHEVQGASLVSERAGGQLGWDTFLTTKTELNDRADVRYEIHAI